MSDLETRIARIEDKIALHDRVVAYFTAIDSLSDIEGLLDCYTEDGVMDLTGLGLANYPGRAAIRDFFEHVFADMTHHAHFVTNFRISHLEAEQATAHAYVIGMGRTRTGTEVVAHARYDIEFVRTPTGWKMQFFTEGALMPLDDTVAAVHARE